MIFLAAFTSACVFASAQNSHSMSKADVDRDMKELSNWGRWGKDDQLGAANLITAAKRKQARNEVKEGFTVSLSHNYLTERSADNTNPFEHRMGPTGAANRGDFVVDGYSWPSYHGYAHTHLDALCHMSIDGKMYNGFSKDEVDQTGAHKLAIENLKDGIVSRGVLVDIPKLKGAPYLEPETAIYPEDLDAWEKMAHVKIEKGDIVFIRTGRWARRLEKDPWQLNGHAAGLHASCARWIKHRDIAMPGSDGERRDAFSGPRRGTADSPVDAGSYGSCEEYLVRNRLQVGIPTSPDTYRFSGWKCPARPYDFERDSAGSRELIVWAISAKRLQQQFGPSLESSRPAHYSLVGPAPAHGLPAICPAGSGLHSGLPHDCLIAAGNVIG